MKKIITLISSPVLMAVCLVLFAVSMAVATFYESANGTELARHYFYNAKWFELILLTGSLNLLTSIFTKKLYRFEKLSIFLFHSAFIVIILGAGITRYIGFEGTMQIREGESSNSITLPDGSQKLLPFSLTLTDFIVEYYPGSQNPSGYESKVSLTDSELNIKEDRRIFMNNILKHRGYRFYQSSYHKDMLGTVLSVSKDGLGTFVTYLGYLLLALGMAWSLLNKNSRFINLIKSKGALSIIGILFIASLVSAQSTDSIPVIPREHAEKFGKILVRDYQGRTKPITTLASDIFRKVNRKTDYKGQDAVQVLLGTLVYPEKWQSVKIVYAGDLVSEVLDINDKRASLIESYLGNGIFVSSNIAFDASRKQPASRSKTDNAIIRFDERLNILYHWFMGNMLNIYPVPDDSSGKWLNPITVQGKIKTADSVFVENIFSMYIDEIKNSTVTGDWSMPDKIVESISKYQKKYGNHLPSDKKIETEQWYYKTEIFKYVYYLYILFGFLILIFQFINIFSVKKRFKIITYILTGIIAGAFLFHTFGLGIRWYISGHAPWSNAYESLIFIAWTAVLAGLIFLKRNVITTSLATIMASIFLMTAHMSWMDPQITNLVPVLKSVWLVIHVAVITSSYGFLGISSIMALINLIIMAFQTTKNYKNTSVSILQMNSIIEISMIIGLYLLTIGTFLGGVWANVSWGRYWGWDSKETWAMITVIVYAFVLHMRLVPKLKGKILFNVMALLAYASVMMTYFGVNYYLTGLHSYASGDPAPVPPAVFYAIGFIALIITGATLKSRRLKKQLN